MANVMTPEFRVSFPNVFKAKKNELNGRDEYSLVALFPKGADLTVLKKAAQEAIEEKWGTDKKKWPTNLRTPFRDQGEKAKENDEGKTVLPLGHEAGAIFLNLKSQQKPGVVDANVQPIIESSEFYGGCYARATIRAFAYDQMGNRGVSFSLQNVQKTRDGEPFGAARIPAEQDFAPIAGSGTTTDSTDLFN